MSEKPTKYHSIKTVIDGITFDSRKEATVYGQLKMMQKSGVILGFDLQPVFEYQIMYTCQSTNQTMSVKRKYIADFSVDYPDLRTEIIDVKGVKTAIYKQKKKIIEKLYGIQIIEK